jgi:hypothetical protein
MDIEKVRRAVRLVRGAPTDDNGFSAPILPPASRPMNAGGGKGAPIKPPVQRPTPKPGTSQPVKK